MISYAIVIYCGKVYHVMKTHYIDVCIYCQCKHSFRTLYIQMSSATCFGHFWPPLGRFYNSVWGYYKMYLMMATNGCNM